MERQKIGIIGLGYVGCPLACLFATKHDVVAFDINASRVAALAAGIDETEETGTDRLKHAIECGIKFTTDETALRECDAIIIAVPTPVDSKKLPDLRPLRGASETAGRNLKKGAVVIYESTVYPRVTEDICIPVVEKASNMKFNVDFFAGYSPERINPGDPVHRVENILKITSGSTPAVAKYVDDLYNSVLQGGTYLAPSIKVAEAAKIIENSQRDINIAFVNEITQIMHALDIPIKEVLKAAGTKWNFHNYKPGLVGGHCIGVDPYYLISLAEECGVRPRLMTEARFINDTMANYVGVSIMRLMNSRNKVIYNSRILVVGFTFKPDTPDTRNTKVADLYSTLKQFTPNVEVFDPIVIPEHVKKEYGIDVITDYAAIEGEKYDVIVVAVPHRAFKNYEFKHLLKDDGFSYLLAETPQVDDLFPSPVYL